MSLTIKDLKKVRELLYDVSAKWYDIGVELDVPLNTLKNIQSSCRTPEECLREMVIAWLNSDTPTPQGLAAALSAKAVGESQLAKRALHLKQAQQVLSAETVEAEPMELQEVTGVVGLRLSSHHKDIPSSPSQNKPTTEPKADKKSNTDSALKETATESMPSGEPQLGYSHEGSNEPNSPKSGKFPFLDTTKLSDEEKRRLEGRLGSESEELQEKFADLVSDTVQALQEDQADIEKLKVYLKSYHVPVNASDNSVAGVMLTAGNSWHFLNYRILKKVILKFGSKEIKKDLDTYESEFKDYCRRRLYEVPINMLLQGSKEEIKTRVCIKMDMYFDTPLKYICILEDKISKILGTQVILIDVKRGCVELVYNCLKISDELFPLSTYQEEQLRREGVVMLYSTHHEYSFQSETVVPADPSVESRGLSSHQQIQQQSLSLSQSQKLTQGSDASLSDKYEESKSPSLHEGYELSPIIDASPTVNKYGDQINKLNQGKIDFEKKIRNLEIFDKFCHLINEVTESLKRQTGIVQKIVVKETEMSVIEEFKQAESVEDIWKITSSHSILSLFNFYFLDEVITNFGTDTDREKLSEYKEELRDYCRQNRIRDIPNELLKQEDSDTVDNLTNECEDLISFTFDKEEGIQHCTMDRIIKLRRELCRVLGVKYLSLHCVADHFVLVFKCPALKKIKFPLSEQQKYKLEKLKVVRLSLKQFEMRQISQPEKPEHWEVVKQSGPTSPGDTKLLSSYELEKMSVKDEVGEHFGQRRPPLSVTISQILQRYPDGQIFKEMIQNADDAGATKVQFYVDCRQHDSSSLLHRDLAPYQGPALISANDAVFSEEDWEGIQSLQQSIKAEDPFKVGRFGIGFNSVYHLTDVPAIISGNKIGYLEPQEQLWKGESGQSYKLSQVRNTDHLRPLDGIAGFSSSCGSYPKTLFRFPLRETASKLSDTLYNVQKVNELIEALRAEAKYLLLFLRSVNTIEVINIDQYGNHTMTFQTKIADKFVSDVMRERNSFLQELKSCHSSNQYSFSKVINFTARFDVEVYDAKTRRTTTSHWLVANQVGSLNGTVRAASGKQKVFPWVGTALELDNPGDGRIFCFLPMPVEAASNLPVHVNGTFSLTDDRRSLKWPGVERKNDPTADWNAILVKEVIPSCYVSLLLAARQYLDHANFYKAWPNVNALQYSNWGTLLAPVLNAMMSDTTIWSEALTQQGVWVKPKSATYVPKGGKLISVVEHTLANCKVKLANVPNVIWDCFAFTKLGVDPVTPKFVREKLRSCPGSYTSIDSDSKRELLRYCLSDGGYNDLLNIQLLPLANGSFTAFTARHPYYSSGMLYLCTAECPKYLLPNLNHKLVDVSGDSELQGSLSQVASCNYTQLQLLNVGSVASLLDEAMPSGWKRSIAVTFPNLEFPSDWFEKFWKWAWNKSLHNFQNKFLVPVQCPGKQPSQQFKVIKLAKSQPVLYFPSHNSGASTLLSALDKFGVMYCQQSVFPYMAHSQLSTFIQQYSPTAVLDAIALTSYYYNVDLTSQEAQTLRNVFQQVTLPRNNQNVLQKLKIFMTCTNTSNSLYSLSGAREKSLLRNVIIEPSNAINLSSLPTNFVFFANEYYQNQLLNRLGYGVPNVVSFLEQWIFPHLASLSEPSIDTIMVQVLDMYQSLCYTSTSITGSIQNLRFVKVASGQRMRPSELYDPSNSTISDMFKGQSVFPTAPYDSSKYINVLRSCGLCTSVAPQKILDLITANSLTPYANPQPVNQVTMTRLRAILKYITSSILNSSVSCQISHSIHRGYLPFSSALKLLSNNRSWLPVLSERPTNYPSCLTWKGSGFSSHVVALSNTACVSRTNSPNDYLLCGSQVFFTEPLSLLTFEEPVNSLLPHFQHVIAHKDDMTPDTVLFIIQCTYAQMLNMLRRGKKSYLTGLNHVKEWIYIKRHNKFVGVEAVALKQNPSFRHNIEPYLHILPDSISNYHQLFTAFGMNEMLSQTQIVSILDSIKTNPSFVTPSEAWSSVMAILNWLTESGTKEVVNSVPIPAESSSKWPDLRDAGELVYTDNDFLKEFISSSESDQKLCFVDSRISTSLAKCLKITPLSEELDISEDTFEDAGQHEPLTVRLKNILRDYKDGLTIIKELIQNADDAEATEINICYDIRSHKMEKHKLFFPGMSESHGPALIIHNNSTFSDEDFKNIQKLAAATKQDKHLKIGKFGIGFCSVYHITDVPSFVSRDRLYIFDPTLKHLGKEAKNPAQPGKRVKFLSKVIQRSSQLCPYQGLYGFDRSSAYSGTMFRLPFREVASELSSTCYSHSIQQLLQDISKHGNNLLLFLQHVQKITVQQISDGQFQPTTLCKFTKTTSLPPPISFSPLSTFTSIESNLVRDGVKSANTWLVSQHRTSNGGKTAVASVACLLESMHNSSTHTVQHSLRGEVFCFLPLSQATGLPVHVSCNFAVINNRRGIWTSDEATRSEVTEVQWNKYLMTNVIPVAYNSLLCNLQALHEQNLLESYIFYSLWPLSSKLNQKNPWELFVSKLYKTIPAQKLMYSESLSRWQTVKESKFLSSNILCQSEEPLSCVLDVLHHLCLPMVDLPFSYRSELNVTEGTITENQFIGLFFDNISRFSHILSSRNDVICCILELYASTYDNPYSTVRNLLQSFLASTPCIPCGGVEGDVLRKCSEVIHPKASFAALFDRLENRFPIDMLACRHLATTAMKHAGMMHETITWDILLERAQTIAPLMRASQSVKALNRVKLILSTMSSCVPSQPPNAGLITINSISFLPVLKKPKDYPLQWYGDNHQLLSGNQLMLAGGSYYGSATNTSIAGSQVAFICEHSPEDGGCGYITPNMRALLHLRSSPTYSEVIAHLKVIIDSHHSNLLSPDRITDICSKIYNFIEKLVPSTSTDAAVGYGHKKEGFDLQEMQSIRCIWNGLKFLSIDSVALNWRLKDGPYLYTAPPALSSKERLTSALGIKKTFTHHDAKRALEMMKEDFGTRQIDESCTILLHELLSIFEETNKKDMEVFLPDGQLVLHKSTDLAYNDAPWAVIDNDEYKYVHKMLARDLAIKLGVRLVRSRMLDPFTSDKATYFGGTKFGQREELTRRIQNIIRDYPFDVTILKELLQNADDAKAKKMYIILDKRTHGKESIISKNWQRLQGPALLVWNERTFTEGDLKGIQELGLGSKRSEAETIGQYGIGFNVVYHLTDCPSFITGGETLCVLDPHCEYIEEADKIYPGRRYDNLTTKGFWKRFPNMSSAYLRTGIDNMPPEIMGGSLFRFPIRHSEEMVRLSDILDKRNNTPKPLTSEDLSKLMKEWMPKIKQATFFLNRVTEIKYLVIEDHSRVLTTKFHCRREIPDTPAVKKDFETLHSTISAFREERNCKTCVIMYPLTLIEFACGDKEKDITEKWLIQQGLGDISNEGQTWKYVKTVKPRHGLASPLEVSSSSAERNFEGQLFCFLPLPPKSDVPVHVNGNFVLDSNRRALWKPTNPDNRDDRSTWNDNLFKAIASSYANFLVKARNYYLQCNYKSWTEALLNQRRYYKLFPKFPVTDVNNKWDGLSCDVYKLLLESNARVLCIIVTNAVPKGPKLCVEWHPLQSPSPATQVYFWSDISGEERKVIHPILESIGMKITSASSKIMECFNAVLKKLQKQAMESSLPLIPVDAPYQLHYVIQQQQTPDVAKKNTKKIPYISPSSVFEYYTKFSSFSSLGGNMQPTPLKDTVFGKKETFLLFIKFLLKIEIVDKTNTSAANTLREDGSYFRNLLPSKIQVGQVYTSDSEAPVVREFPGSPFSHFLLLTADGVLRKFDEQNKIFNSKHSQLFRYNLDKFLDEEISASVNLKSSYFITSEDEDRERIYQLIYKIFSNTFPQEMKHYSLVQNIPAGLDRKKLGNYWHCFATDSVFASFVGEFLKQWALLLSTKKQLFSTSNSILPVNRLPSSSPEHIPTTGISSIFSKVTAFMSYTKPDADINTVLARLNMPFLDTQVVTVDVNCPKLTEQHRILSNVYHINENTPITDLLKKEDLDILVGYFSSGQKFDSLAWLNQLKSLPFFEDVTGNYLPIINLTACIWPQSACGVGYRAWVSRLSSVIFVKGSGKWATIGSAVQLSLCEITEEYLYTQYIFPYFSAMNENERFEHLKHIRDHLYHTSKNYSEREISKYISKETITRISNAQLFIYSLKALKCIGHDSTCLQSISYYCDYTQKIFQSFSDQVNILPPNFQDEKWLAFFKDLGLKVSLNQEEYLKFCTIAARGDCSADKSVEYSETLLEYLFSREVRAVWYKDRSFLSRVSNIAFVCAEDAWLVSWITPGASQAGELVRLNGAATHTLTNLIWTVRPIIRLPHVCQIGYILPIEVRVLLNLLNIITAAGTDDVMTNIKNICSCSPYANEELLLKYPDSLFPPSLKDDRAPVITLMNAMLGNLSLLCNKMSEYGYREEIPFTSDLAKLPCIPVYNSEKTDKKVVLVHPSSVLMYRVDDYYPFLHHMPFELSKVSQLLTKIGVENCMSLHHIQIVLEKVFKKSENSDLEPNTKKCVRNAIEQLCKMLSSVNMTQAITSSLEPLYLPDSTDIMKLSTTMLYGDTPSYIGRMHLDLSGTNYSHFDILASEYGADAPNVCRLLPEKVRPLGMSLICRQIPSKESEIVENSEFATELEKAIHCNSTPSAVVKYFSRVVTKPDKEDDLIYQIQKFTSSVKISSRYNLKTEIVLRESKQVIGHIKTEFYLEPGDEESYLYLDSKCDESDLIFKNISEHILTIMSQNKEVSLALRPAITDFITIFIKSGSRRKNQLIDRFRLGIEGVKNDKFKGELGELIPECFHNRLDQDIHNVFKPMEYIGYEDEGGSIIIAQILHLENPHVENNFEKVYYIITGKNDLSGKKVSVLDLYKFLIGQKRKESTLVPYEGESEVTKLRTSQYKDDLVELKKFICEELKKIWILDPQLRRKAVRRLYLRWHPDKNPEDPEKAEKIFIFLRRQIEHLENGEPLDNPRAEDVPEHDHAEGTSPGRAQRSDGHVSTPSTQFRSRGFDFEEWDNTARRHNKAHAQNTGSFPNATAFINPTDPEEGKRWVKQAEIDNRVLIDIDLHADDSNGYAHVCFMAHQVAEKALKGAVYALCGLDGRGLTDHNLTRHAYALREHTQGLAEHTAPLEDYYLNTRYPNRWPGRTIPSDHYQREQASRARDHAKAVLDTVVAIMP